MADLNALIAQGVQFQAPPDPFAQYAKMQQLDQAQQANALNRMKMDEYQRGLLEQNALRSAIRPDFDPTNQAHVAAIYQAAPTLAPKFVESALTARKTGAEVSASDYELKLKKLTKPFRIFPHLRLVNRLLHLWNRISKMAMSILKRER